MRMMKKTMANSCWATRIYQIICFVFRGHLTAGSEAQEDLEEDGEAVETVDGNEKAGMIKEISSKSRGDVADRMSIDVMESDDEDGEGIDPNHEHLSEHTKSLIAHLASLPGFGKTQARISYVPYSAPDRVGSTLAELQLPWRSPTNMGDGEGSMATSPKPTTLDIGSSAKLRLSISNKTVKLDRGRGRNQHGNDGSSGWAFLPVSVLFTRT